ncbi:MAG: NAD-dependent epimerase/dehydratase family protein [Acidobacteria bacterium]|nr:NAD-dependent epimerase/dehydratase family protein [Acidobacteriota bacterium]
MAEKILVTGASGFLGAWVVRELYERGVPFVLFDRDPELRRLDDLLPERPLDIPVETGDIADLDTVLDVTRKHEPTAVIHLAALQMPFCRPNPMLGARVNVLGTLTVFEAARQLHSIEKIVYASSAAVIGPEQFYGGKSVANDAPLAPATHYGVFKQANEGAARVYFQDHGVSSIGLRPWTVYGLGRDQGLTSDATRAIKAALLGREYTIRYSGRNALQFAGDVAAAFVECALDRRQVQKVFNLRGRVVEMQDFIAELDRRLPGAADRIRLSGGPIPVACDLDDTEFRAFLPNWRETPLDEGVDRTFADFRRLQQAGKLSVADLEE